MNKRTEKKVKSSIFHHLKQLTEGKIMKKAEEKEHRIAKDWGFVFEAKLNGDPRAHELFTWKIQMENAVYTNQQSLAEPSSLTSDEKIKAITTILNLGKEETALLKDYLKQRKPLIYLDSLKRNRNQRRSRVISSNDNRFHE